MLSCLSSYKYWAFWINSDCLSKLIYWKWRISQAVLWFTMSFWGFRNCIFFFCHEFLDVLVMRSITLAMCQEAFLLYFPAYPTVHALIVISPKIISNLILPIRPTAESWFLQVWNTFPALSFSRGFCIDGSIGICCTAGIHWIHLSNLCSNMILQTNPKES